MRMQADVQPLIFSFQSLKSNFLPLKISFQQRGTTSGMGVEKFVTVCDTLLMALWHIRLFALRKGGER